MHHRQTTTTPLMRIARQAASLDERRLAAEVGATVPAEDAPMGGTAWLSTWQQVVGKGDGAVFEKRLAWDGWAELAPGWLAVAPEAPPTWLPLLAEGLAASPAMPDETWRAALAETPFGEIVAPLAFTTLTKRGTGAGGDRLGPAARQDLALTLAKRLAKAGERALYAEFEGHRLGAGWITPEAAPEGGDMYRAWVGGLKGDGLLAFLTRYPVLARLWGLHLEQALNEARTVCAHLEADTPALVALFGVGAAGAITGIAAGLSDPHHDGRSVWKVTFESGLSLVYKPRSLEPDHLWAAMVDWLRDEGLTPCPSALTAFDGCDHGWVALAEPAPLADAAAADRYYFRAGAILAACYALDSTDMHCENLMACGEEPVLVDLEAVLQARYEAPAHPIVPFADPAAFASQLGDNALHVALVAYPVPLGREKGRFVDWGALADPIHALIDGNPHLTPVNQDQMAYGDAQMPVPRDHLPTLDGLPLRGRDYAPTLLAGFEAAYRLLLAGRDRLFAPDGPLHGREAMRVRYLFRNTRTYGTMLLASTAAARLDDGRQRSIRLDLIARTYLAQAEKPSLWSVIAAERSALERLDVPHFSVLAGGTTLEGEGLCQEGVFQISPLEGVKRRLDSLSERDLALQTQLIELALSVPAYDLPARPEHAALEATPANLAAAAIAIAERLAERTIHLDDGHAAWLGLYQHARGDLAPGAGGPRFLDGNLGPAVFLAAIAHHTNDSRWADLALAGLRRHREAISQQPERAVAQQGAEGVAAIAFGLAHMGQFLADDSLKRDARALVGLLSAPMWANVKLSEVLGGLAGAILHLLDVAVLLGDDGALQAAIAAAEVLLARSEPLPAGPGWRTLDEKALAGFSHGQAGIAYALAKLSLVTHDPRYQAAGAAALAIEDGLFLAEHGDWNNLLLANPETGEPGRMTSWCHGAPGVALGRLPFISDPARARDLETAVQTTLTHPAHLSDFLCCGNAGRVEVLLEAATHLARPDWLAAAREKAIVIRLDGSSTGRIPRERLEPTFLKGLSGIGYTLLRAADPQRYPSLLVGGRLLG